MSAQFLTLDRWASEVYGEAAPTRRTLIRWAKLELIQPPPQKHGKIYFVVPWARYGAANDQTAPASPPPAKVKHESATSIIERLINERSKAAKKP